MAKNSNLKKKKNRSLNNQFNYIMESAKSFGASKRSYKKQMNVKKTDKIFSHYNYNSIKSTSVSLVNFLKDNYPEVKLIKEITKEHITAFLEFKSFTCNDTTIEKFRQHINSLALFANNIYGCHLDWDVRNIKSKKVKQQTKKGKFMSKEHFEEIKLYLESSSRTIDKNSLLYLNFVRCSGLRIDELTHQKISQIYLTGGEFGFGYIDVTCGKHGRKRIVNIKSAEDLAIVRLVVENAENEELDCITNKKTATLENRLTNLKKKVGIKDELVGWHGVRKLYAQEYYDFIRQTCSRKEAIAKTNEQLGHGYNRGEHALATYVTNMW